MKNSNKHLWPSFRHISNTWHISKYAAALNLSSAEIKVLNKQCPEFQSPFKASPTAWLIQSGKKEEKWINPGNRVNVAFSPKALITSNNHCVSWCSLPATMYWSGVSLDEEMSQRVDVVGCSSDINSLRRSTGSVCCCASNLRQGVPAWGTPWDTL